MKATGIVRRIDDLGRVVIPKEIRRTMRIREGDPLEIYTDREGEVIFKKYSPIGELSGFAAQYAETLNRTAGLPVVLCDRDLVVACAGLPKKEIMDRKISSEMDSVMDGRSLYIGKGEARISIAEGVEKYNANVVMPIIAEGDIIGAVVSVHSPDNLASEGTKGPDEAEIKLIQTAAAFLSRQLES